MFSRALTTFTGTFGNKIQPDETQKKQVFFCIFGFEIFDTRARKIEAISQYYEFVLLGQTKMKPNYDSRGGRAAGAKKNCY